MSEVEVRRVGPDDWRVWRDVRLAALEDAPDIFPGELAPAQRYNEADWRARLDPYDGVWLLAEAPGGPVGQAGAWMPFGPPPVLVGMWVRPDWRGRGVGDALVAEVLDWAREASFDRVDLWVLESNQPARHVYQRHGFVATDQYLPSAYTPNQREVMMTRQLGRGRRG
ncbi:MAG: GNAT family N-acetyltransferase [Micromonosporaceae bacterium]